MAMLVENHTPFAQMVHANEDSHARLFDILIVKATFCLSDHFSLSIAPEQEPLNFTDHCHSEVNQTSLRYPSDLVPYKPKTDIIVIADAWSPGQSPAQEWVAGIGIRGPDFTRSAEAKVTGPRNWLPRWRGSIDDDEGFRKGDDPRFLGWDISEPASVQKVPLRWELAFGGPQHRGDEILVDERNPIGRGWIDRDLTDHRYPVAAPQILPSNAAVPDPYQTPAPFNLGPIPPAWLPRRPLGGTYDADWVQNRWPHWPKDYDFAYHNSAPGPLQLDRFLQGNEQILLSNLRPENPQISFVLPGLRVNARLIDSSGAQHVYRANADTLYLDLTEERAEDCLICVTWRLPFLQRNWAELHVEASLSEVPDSLPAPHPHDLFREEKDIAHVK